MIGLTAAVDLACRTGDPRDVEVARRWIERTGAPATGGFALTGLARIGRATDPGAALLLSQWAHQSDHRSTPEARAARAWGLEDADLRRRVARRLAAGLRGRRRRAPCRHAGGAARSS